MGYMTYPGYYGYSSGNTLIVIFALLLKLFAFVLFIAVAVGIVMWIRNANLGSFMGQKSENEDDKTSVDTPIIKTTAYIGAVILGILILCSMVNRVGWYGTGYGVGSAFTIAAILIFIIKALAVFLVISLIMAAVALAREQSGRGRPNTFGDERR